MRRLRPGRLISGDLISSDLSHHGVAGMALAIEAQVGGGHRIVGLKLRAAGRTRAVLMDSQSLLESISSARNSHRS